MFRSFAPKQFGRVGAAKLLPTLLAISSLWLGGHLSPGRVQAQSPDRLDTAASTHRIEGQGFPADASSLGIIPDSDIASPQCQNNSTTFRDVTFTISGVAGYVNQIGVVFNASHPFLQDLEVTLKAPTGQSLLLFSATGTTSTTPNSCAGSSNDLINANTYSFSDTATTNWWTGAAAGNPVPGGVYRTVVSGIGGATNPPPVTSLDAAFHGALPNGTWTLRFRDRGIGGMGSVTAATLVMFTAYSRNAVLDFDGDGRTDDTVTRSSGANLLW